MIIDEWLEPELICRRYQERYRKRPRTRVTHSLMFTRSSDDPFVVSLDPEIVGVEWSARELAEYVTSEFGFSMAISTARRLFNQLVRVGRARRTLRDTTFFYEIRQDFNWIVRLRFPQEFLRRLVECLERVVEREDVYIDLVKHAFSTVRQIAERLVATYRAVKPNLLELKRLGWINNWTLTPPEIAQVEPIEREQARIEGELEPLVLRIEEIERLLETVEEEEERERLESELQRLEGQQFELERQLEEQFDLELEIVGGKYWYPVNWIRWEFMLENFWYERREGRESKFELRGEFETPLDIVVTDLIELPEEDRVELWEQCKSRAEEMLLEFANDVYDLRMGWREGVMVELRPNVNYESLMGLPDARQNRAIRGLEEIERIFLDEDANLEFISLFQLFFEVGGWQLEGGRGMSENQEIERRWYWV